VSLQCKANAVPLTKFNVGLSQLHSADDEAVNQKNCPSCGQQIEVLFRVETLVECGPKLHYVRLVAPRHPLSSKLAHPTPKSKFSSPTHDSQIFCALNFSLVVLELP